MWSKIENTHTRFNSASLFVCLVITEMLWNIWIGPGCCQSFICAEMWNHSAADCVWMGRDNELDALCKNFITAPLPVWLHNRTLNAFTFELRDPSGLVKGYFLCDILWYPSRFYSPVLLSPAGREKKRFGFSFSQTLPQVLWTDFFFLFFFSKEGCLSRSKTLFTLF